MKMRGKCPKCGTELIASEKRVPFPQKARDAAWEQFDKAFKAFDTVLLDLIADWRKCVCPLEGPKPTCLARRACADHLEAELTPFVQDLGAKIMEQSEAARIHGQYEVCIALKTAVETMEDAMLGPEMCARGCGKLEHLGQACGW